MELRAVTAAGVGFDSREASKSMPLLLLLLLSLSQLSLLLWRPPSR